MRHSFKILFLLLRTKQNSAGQSPIYCRITINGQAIHLSTGQYINPVIWDIKNHRVKGRNAESNSINEFLENKRQEVRNAASVILQRGLPLNIENIQNELKGIDETNKGLIQTLDYHIKLISGMVPRFMTPATLSGYRTVRKYLLGFLQRNYRRTDLPLRDLKLHFINEFEVYIMSNTACNRNGTVKHLKRLKRVIHVAIENGWLETNPFRMKKLSFEPSNRSFLTRQELERIEKFSSTSVRLNKVRDLFLFSCYTGKGYKDLVNLKKENLSIWINGKKWLTGERFKTGIRSDVPLLPIAIEILERYENDPEVVEREALLPMISNQKFNAYLKDIARLCNIQKELTTYMARHTFATTVCSDNDVPIETISKMLGHTNLKTTQIYQKTTPQKVSRDMQILENKLCVESER